MPARGEASALLLLAAVAWCTATAGGAGTRDLLIATVLVAGARALAPGSGTARDAPAAVGLVMLLCWMVAVGVADAGWSLVAVRLPWLLCVAALAVGAARRLPATHQDTATTGLAVLGAVLAGIAVSRWAWGVVTTGAPPTGARADAVLGYANALGAVLLATALLTYRALPRRFGRAGIALLVLQLVGVVATGSRIALLTATVIAAGYLVRGRQRWLRVTAVVFCVVSVAVLVLRFVTSPPERLYIWRGALGALARDPLTGRGPTPVLIDTGSASVLPTTHAHNELVQLAVEYGLVGVLLATIAGYLALRAARWARPPDRPLALAAAALAALAVTDFALRVPAVALMLAVIVGVAASGSAVVAVDPVGARPTRPGDGSAPSTAASDGSSRGTRVNDRR